MEKTFDIYNSDSVADFILFDDALDIELAYDFLLEPKTYTVEKGDNLFRIALRA